MTPKRYRQIRECFEASLQQETGRRAAWLEAACQDDDQLRSEVHKLLIADARSGEFIDRHVLQGAGLAPAENEDDGALPHPENGRIGPYELLRELGHGGMGCVYLASRADQAFRKQVALKLVHRERTSPELLRRFQQERQILAALDHPHIARLLDGGTTQQGLPYLVMEYVEGTPIDVYCDAHKLNVTERLKLFRMVCAAVSYAHQNLIVHRDLKPSNILVTADGNIKLLDFGIAKLLPNGEETMALTQTGLHVMTPKYASPEQIKAEGITTATDIYSLGVILYELLTGRPPYRVKSWALHEIAHAICEEDPVRPSAGISRAAMSQDGESGPDTLSEVREGKPARLKRRLAGDVDNIVMKALQKSPAQRYASVEQFSEDIRRHLEGLPVIARNGTTIYHISKFVRRHRIAVTAATLVLATMMGAIAATKREAGIAAAQAQKAELERGRADLQKQLAEQQRNRAAQEAERAQLKSREADQQQQLAESRAKEAVFQRRRAEEKAGEADTQREAAERRFKYARDLAGSLFGIFDEVKDLPGSKQARLLIARRAEEYTKLLVADGGDPTLANQLAAARSLGQTYDHQKQPTPTTPLKLMDTWFLAGNGAGAFRVRVDTSIFHSGTASGCIQAMGDAGPSEFGTLMQKFSAEEYRGKRLRLSAYIKSENVESQAGLWMRIDGKQPMLAFDNMADRPIKGSRDWQKYDIVLDVPQNSAAIFFGILLDGRNGRVWIDDVQFESVGPEVSVTGKTINEIEGDADRFARIPLKPANLDFEN